MRVIIVLLLGLAAFAAPADPAKSPFNPARHMRVAEVKPGMTGHGLSVFNGTKIEQFEVEVISVLHNFNPQHDVILIRCKGQNLEHTGAIQGMSGSPIYLRDDQGRSRMVGAFAYGFPLAKDPIAGVQPIEYMLDLPADPQPEAHPGPGASAGLSHFSALDAMNRARSAWLNPPDRNVARSSTRLAPLTTPMMISGLSSNLIEQLSPAFQAHNIQLLQAGGSSSRPAEDDPPATIEPGSTLTAPVLTGDVDLVATGTVTEVIDGVMFGFGHPFNNEGPISLPFGAGRVNGIIPTLTSSFKLGTMTDLRGTLTNDQTFGIVGKMGEAPKSIPIDIKVKYANGSQEHDYHYDCVIHPFFTPMMSAMAVLASATATREMPLQHTLDYDLTIEFPDGRTVKARNRLVNAGPRGIAAEVAAPLMLAADNPFARVLPTRISGQVIVDPMNRGGEVLSIRINRMKYQPGETVKGFITYRPFQAQQTALPFEFPLPEDLADGQYQLIVGDHSRYLSDEAGANPWRFRVDNIDDLFKTMNELNGLRTNAVYVRLVQPADGVAIGRNALPKLPASKRGILIGSGRGDAAPAVPSAVKAIETDLVISGSAEFAITIENRLSK